MARSGWFIISSPHRLAHYFNGSRDDYESLCMSVIRGFVNENIPWEAHVHAGTIPLCETCMRVMRDWLENWRGK